MKVKAPIHSECATGKFDGGIIFERTRGLCIAKRMKRPPNPQSTSQVLTRNRLSILSRTWGDLTEEQRQAWDEAAPGLATGYNNYVGLGIKALEMGETPIEDPPPTPGPNDIEGPELRTGNLGELDIVWDPATQGDKIEVRCTGAIPDGREPKNNEYRVKGFPPASAGTFTLTDLPPSSKVGVRLRPMFNNGQAGNTWEAVGYAGDPLYVGYLPFSLNKSIMVKMDLVGFRKLRTINYGPRVKNLFGPALSPTGSHIYCFDEKTPPTVYKIRTNDLQIEDQFTPVGVGDVNSYNVIGNSENYLYLSGFSDPATVYKIDLNTKALVSSIGFGAGSTEIWSLRIDSGGQYLYGIVSRPAARFFKIDLSSFTLLNLTALSAPSGPGRGLVLDEANGHAYISGGGAASRIFKCLLSDTSEVEVKSFSSDIAEMFQGEGPLDGYIYFTSTSSPGEVGRFRISDFTFQGKVTGQPGEDLWHSLLLDTARDNLFTVNRAGRANLIKISTTPFQRVAGLSFAPGEENVIEMAGFLSL